MNESNANRKTRPAGWLLAVAILVGLTTVLPAAQASPPVETDDTPEDSVTPCTIVRQVGSRPSIGTDPLLGMIEVDPDRCVHRMIETAQEEVRNLLSQAPP